MYDALTTKELTVLQSLLYEGTEKSYLVAELGRENADYLARYRSVHHEVGGLFIEAGMELLGRLGEFSHAA